MYRWLASCAMTAALIVSALTFTGCTVPPDGRVGVGRDADGELRVYLRTCQHSMDGATLYWPDDPEGATSNQEVFAEWTFEQQPGPMSVDWPLLGRAQSGAVKTQQPLEKMPGPPRNMGIYAWTHDSSYSAGGPYLFTSTDLTNVRPGHVLVSSNTGRDTDPPNKIISLSNFDALDCLQYR